MNCYLYSEDVNDIMKTFEEYMYSDSVTKKIHINISLIIVKKYSYSSGLYVRCVLI